MKNIKPNNDVVEDLQPSIKSNIDIKNILDEIESNIKKHTILPNGASTALTLWIASTYCINDFAIFPKLSIISPEKRCGKSTLLDVLEGYCHKPYIASNMTPATIFRTIDKYQPTLMLDEADTFVNGSASDLTGIINSGHGRNRAFITRSQGDNFEPTKFSTWTPMALASIGDLQSTIMDRSIVIRMLRKKPSESVCRLPLDFKVSNKTLREELLKWSLDNSNTMKQSPSIPSNLGNDRDVDNWIPLFTLAKLAGVDWHNKCEASYNLLSVKEELSDSTILLSDIREIFSTSTNKLSSADLVKKLVDDRDKPWCEYKNGRPLTQNTLASLLSRYGIRPKGIRVGSSTLRGYELANFNDAFERYLPPNP